jgi:hypothetical protein
VNNADECAVIQVEFCVVAKLTPKNDRSTRVTPKVDEFAPKPWGIDFRSWHENPNVTLAKSKCHICTLKMLHVLCSSSSLVVAGRLWIRSTKAVYRGTLIIRNQNRENARLFLEIILA